MLGKIKTCRWQWKNSNHRTQPVKINQTQPSKRSRQSSRKFVFLLQTRPTLTNSAFSIFNFKTRTLSTAGYPDLLTITYCYNFNCSTNGQLPLNISNSLRLNSGVLAKIPFNAKLSQAVNFTTDHTQRMLDFIKPIVIKYKLCNFTVIFV